MPWSAHLRNALERYGVIEEEPTRPAPAASRVPAGGWPSGPLAGAPPWPTPTGTGPVETTETYKLLVQRVFADDSAYTRLRRAIEALRDEIPDEDKRFRAALRASGLDGKTVAQALATHQQALAAERQRFQTAVTSMQAEEIESKQHQMQGLTTERQANETQIEKLKQRNAAIETEAAQLTTAIDTGKAKCARVAAEFTAAADRIANDITTTQARVA